MKCQHCNHNEAEITIGFHYHNQTWEYNLCTGCAGRLRQFADAAFQEYGRHITGSGQGFSGAVMSPTTEAPSAEWFPDDAGEALKQRRRLNQLRTRLETAVLTEQYEAAAQLRDEIKNMEKGVCTYD